MTFGNVISVIGLVLIVVGCYWVFLPFLERFKDQHTSSSESCCGNKQPGDFDYSISRF